MVAKLLLSHKQALELADQATAAAQKATRMKTDFIANVSHEIRTPLNAMLGVADLIAETRLDEVQNRYVEIFRVECEHMHRLIGDVLDLSKIEAGKLTIEAGPVQIGELARTVMETFTPQAQTKGLRLQFNIEQAADRVWKVDQQRVRQVMSNLLSNALKFTHEGGISLAIGVQNQASPTPWLTFSVADTGTGIPRERHDQVFKRFEQMGDSEASRIGGSGLGLSITRGLVERMGGTIGFDSELLKGSRFFFTLPTEAAEPAISAAPATKVAARARSAGKRILLVEDYKVNQMVFSAYLQELGCHVEIASDGREGVTAFAKQHFDLILMDVQMPVLDGLSAAREIRSLERQDGRKQTPIMALTASALTEDRARCSAAGCTAFLAKPLRKAEMIENVERLLGLAEEDAPLRVSSDDGPPLDAEVEALRPEFIEELGDTIRKIFSSLEAADYAESGRCAHRTTIRSALWAPSISSLNHLRNRPSSRSWTVFSPGLKKDPVLSPTPRRPRPSSSRMRRQGRPCACGARAVPSP
ncbi:MAG: response regulator [Verrucomicrobia bacterium]|nr:response regulator [Verrucomicrobiota bacterium]